MGRRGKITAIPSRLAGLAIGALFVWAGAAKALDPAHFAEDIANFRLLPRPAAVVLAFYLPWLEVICGAALAFKRPYRGALILVTALCFVFLAALASAMARGLDISCGCFGHAHPHPLGISLLVDAALLAALLSLLAEEFPRRRTSAAKGAP